MNIKNLLHSGHTFTPAEYELETKYVATNILLYFMTPIYFFVALFYFLEDEMLKSTPYVIVFFISIFSLYSVRKIDKNNYQLIVYFSMTFYTLAIFLGYYVEPEFTPAAAWIIILIITSFLVTSIYVGMFITTAYFFFLIYMDFYVLEINSYEYLVLKIAPVLIGIFAVYMFERKFVSTILLLEKSNVELENKVAERTAQLKDEKEFLDYQAHYDHLTKLPNRNNFYKVIKQWIDISSHSNTSFTLFFIDLDRFKRVNDSLGHSAGDKVLKVIAKRVSKYIDKDAFFARISGDEFTLLFSIGCEDDIAKELISIIEEGIMIGDNTLYLSASIGISRYPSDSRNYKDLIKYADTSMFEAKKMGRGMYQFYKSEMTDRVQEVVLMETELQHALKHDEFELYYQPQIDTRDNTLSGVEILVRWNHPTMGLLMPSEFIPLAEDTSIILALDYYILKQGMLQISKWKRLNPNLPRVSFNFSAKHFHRENFIQDIEALLSETACDGKWIELEMTENHVIPSIGDAIDILIKLKTLGIKIAIDDFGTGYSSLSYLKRLPVDTLKIDQSFIKKIPYDSVDMSITKAIISISNSMKLRVIAEGVETEVQKEYLSEYDCYHVQGYLYYAEMKRKEFQDTFF